MIGEQGVITGLYNLIYEEQHIVKEVLADYFLLEYDKITINLRSSDLSVVVHADIFAHKKERISIIIVNRLDEYFYNINDNTILYKLQRIIKNKNRLKLIKKIMKKSGRK